MIHVPSLSELPAAAETPPAATGSRIVLCSADVLPEGAGR